MAALPADERVVIVGAGVGGLSAALALSARGFDVTVLERGPEVGGKMREVPVGGARIDGGPTVFTMRWVFEELFEEAGLSFSAEAPTTPATLLARHAWEHDQRLDLFVDIERSAEAVAAFSGAEEARRWRAFVKKAGEVYAILETPFLKATKPDPISLVNRVGWSRIGDLFALEPFSTLMDTLARRFRDPRLVQLYGRYATYCGSSPYLAPATLMLVAHVEQRGVWYVDGGMYRLAEALRRAAERKGARFRCLAEAREVVVGRGGVEGVVLSGGERLSASRVIVNADVNAVATGLFGEGAARAARPTPRAKRSLSAMVWTARGKASGFPLARHNVFFSRDYPDEFTRTFSRSILPDEPTVYICAQDRDEETGSAPVGEERFQILVNAPASGDETTFETESAPCRERLHHLLDRCGLRLELSAEVLTTPADFAALFPATGGALYGRASHGWTATFARADGRTRIPGLYLAGGSVHPAPGVPMAALSGRLAAAALISDCASIKRYPTAAISGGTSTRFPTTA